jgi:hypothetical protein
LHWLAPDLPYAVDGTCLAFDTWRIDWNTSPQAELDIVRAGEPVHGQPDCSDRLKYRGWMSRSYAEKIPANSIRITSSQSLPVRIVTAVTLCGPRPDLSQLAVSHRDWTVELEAIGAVDPIRAAHHRESGVRL